jgi:AcrR family transcriptional regulator
MVSTRKPGRPTDPALQERRRADILDAAGLLFAAHGYAAADTQQLADALGIAKGTVFRYFPTKRELFVACIGRALDRLGAAVEAAAARATDPFDKLEHGMRAYLRFFDAHPQVVELMILERAELKDRKSTYFDRRDRDTATQRGWRDLVAGLVAAGRIRPLAPDKVLAFVGDLLYGAVFSRQMSGDRRPLAARYPELRDLVRHALAADGDRAGSHSSARPTVGRRPVPRPRRRPS